MRLIDEQQIIDLLENCTDLQEAKSVIASDGLQAVNNWRPVSERLPSKNGMYLAQMRFTVSAHCIKTMHVLHFRHGSEKTKGWRDMSGKGMDMMVVAWMPLPEPYKEREQE